MTKDARIVITGFMAAGKSTVAESLALLLGSQMIDLDEELAARSGRSVCGIIEEEGEAFFRRAETSVLQDILENKFVRIIALGGGAWTNARNRALIAEQGCRVVWLDAPFELCWQRIADAKNGETAKRPLARDYVETKNLYEKRRALYELADFHIKVIAERAAEEIAREIAESCIKTQ